MEQREYDWAAWVGAAVVFLVGAVLLWTTVPSQLRLDNSLHLVVTLVLTAIPVAVALSGFRFGFTTRVARWTRYASLPLLAYGVIGVFAIS